MRKNCIEKIEFHRDTGDVVNRNVMIIEERRGKKNL